MKCQSCKWTGGLIDCDCAGACDGCVFCPACGAEFSSITGRLHKANWCCLDVIGEEWKKTVMGKYRAWVAGKGSCEIDA